MTMPTFIQRKAELEPGMYRMKLIGVTGTDKRVYDFDNKTMTDKTEPGVLFLFQDTRTSKELSDEVRAVLNPKSTLIKRAKGMGGKLFTNDVCNDAAKFWSVLTSLEGKDFLVNVEVNEKGTWNKITAVLPTEGAAPAKEMDEIPF